MYGPEAPDSMEVFPSHLDQVSSGTSARLHPQELGHSPTAREAKMPTLVFPVPWPMHQKCCGNDVAGRMARRELSDNEAVERDGKAER
jgi:hypothetical protein